MSDSALDPVVFNEMRELMEEALPAFIETYLENSPKLLEAMSQALPNGDLDGVYHNAHQLKGGSGSIGAMQVFQLAKDIEEQAKLGEGSSLESLIEQLNAAYEQAEAELRLHL